MKKQALILFLLIILMGCQKDPLVETLDFKDFRMDVPAHWKSVAGQGYDSKTGRITNGKDELVYDYGWYSYDFRNETTATHTRITTNINGRPALIVRPKEKNKGIIGIYIEVDSQLKFNLYGQNIRDEETVIRIFKSVRF